MSVAVPLVLHRDLVSSRKFLATAAGGESAAYQFGASEVLRTTVENRNGRITIDAALTGASTQRNREVIRVEAPASGGFLPAVNTLAKRLDERAAYFSTKNDKALQVFAAAAQAPNVQTRVRLLNDAIAVDPGFGLAYIALAEALLQTGQDPAPVIAQASGHRNEFAPLDQARFSAIATRVSRAPLPQQEIATRKVLELAPNDVDSVAALGSLSFLRGDAAAGERLLNRALELSPANPNLRHQLALGLLQTRRFVDAEKVFTGLDNNAALLPELATCILLEGDVNRADIVFDRYLKLQQPNQQLATLFHATWLALSQRTAKAIDLLESANLTDPSLRVIALSQDAIFRLLSGDAPGARKSAASAAQVAGRPTPFVSIVLLLTNGQGAPQHWKDQVDAAGLGEQAKQALLGYGFFLNGHYTEAAQIWQDAVQRSGGIDLRARTMLAASLDRAGRAGESANARAQPFVPELGDLYAAVSFSEMRRLLKLDRH
jgi:Flp pilus assembly protein TadD